MDDKEAEEGNSNKVQQYWEEGQGGFRAAMFLFVFAALENMGFVANMCNFVLYFKDVMHFGITGSAIRVIVLMALTFLLSIVGGFISDNFLSRFTTAIIFGGVELQGLMMLTIQAHYPHLRPRPCRDGICDHLEGGNAMFFYITLCLLALGTGGVRGSTPALGADQFNAKDPKESQALASYFNWLFLSITVGATFGVTFIVYLSTIGSWDLSFLTCLAGALIGFIALAIGKPFFRIRPPKIIALLRGSFKLVIVVAYRNRGLSLPEKHELHEINDKETSLDDERIPHSDQFRRYSDRWRVCTVTQVEELKVLIRMVPILASTVGMNVCLAQLQTFTIYQGSAMDRKLGSFEIPAASVPVIPVVIMNILMPFYEYIFVPFARKITNHPSGITQLQRIGAGLVLSIVSMSVAGMVEVKRKNHSLIHYKSISVFWLTFQYGTFGVADMLTLPGLLEFFYKEAPVGIRSLSTSFTWLSLSVGYILSFILVVIINLATKKFSDSGKGWLNGKDLDSSNLSMFYWFLAILSLVNFVNYLFWAHWYKYKKELETPLEVPSNKASLVESNLNHDKESGDHRQEERQEDDQT
ncbi:hypothetical protein Scep_028713 [Stephania cephalantha]|uniref:Uncharacterized protein n=1 Tax=Stephania cephalantha TaxID=152367 RepID=A0AAP0EAG7_9MAGN